METKDRAEDPECLAWDSKLHRPAGVTVEITIDGAPFFGRVCAVSCFDSEDLAWEAWEAARSAVRQIGTGVSNSPVVCVDLGALLQKMRERREKKIT